VLFEKGKFRGGKARVPNSPLNDCNTPLLYVFLVTENFIAARGREAGWHFGSNQLKHNYEIGLDERIVDFRR